MEKYPENIRNKEATLRCPACKSVEVDKIGSATIGIELFITFRCLNCGKEEILDEYQLDDWFE